MPPRKSDRVRTIESQSGRPNYSDTTRRASSVSSVPGRRNAGGPTGRAVTTDGPPRATATTDLPPRAQFQELEISPRLQPQQYPSDRDLSRIVEDVARRPDDDPREGGSPERELRLGSVCQREEDVSENEQRVYRTEPEPSRINQPQQTLSIPRSDRDSRAGSIDFISRPNEERQPQTDQGTLQETTASGGRRPEHALHASIQQGVLSSGERDQQVQRERTSEEPERPIFSQVKSIFTSTPSPFLSSKRILCDQRPVIDHHVTSIPMRQVEDIRVVQPTTGCNHIGYQTENYDCNNIEPFESSSLTREQSEPVKNTLKNEPTPEMMSERWAIDNNKVTSNTDIRKYQLHKTTHKSETNAVKQNEHEKIYCEKFQQENAENAIVRESSRRKDEHAKR
ncbi:uncharacterized protein MELLADRAFT_61671 [Melampsora larici-populina 98AG31]|uniref:Uncharacterized protein n=1 Tax=Melampsora larici-populina (strain 98AG31 / pathotype 3-4-7) TaxID=747676 RepID=F4RFV3_MELLP|nr:uncharacterized protein MELLADRAFT_61671 [Melampsora larici-populina 98AG31]EGG08727.1 hypothetical protein MELLADRAFT_61671 [Melampsora larici-populina 98AG31]